MVTILFMIVGLIGGAELWWRSKIRCFILLSLFFLIFCWLLIFLVIIDLFMVTDRQAPSSTSNELLLMVYAGLEYRSTSFGFILESHLSLSLNIFYYFIMVLVDRCSIILLYSHSWSTIVILAGRDFSFNGWSSIGLFLFILYFIPLLTLWPATCLWPPLLSLIYSFYWSLNSWRSN